MKTFREAKIDFEREYLRDAIEEAGRNLSKAARMAGMDRKNFWTLAKKHGLWPVPRTYTVTVAEGLGTRL